MKNKLRNIKNMDPLQAYLRFHQLSQGGLSTTACLESWAKEHPQRIDSIKNSCRSCTVLWQGDHLDIKLAAKEGARFLPRKTIQFLSARDSVRSKIQQIKKGPSFPLGLDTLLIHLEKNAFIDPPIVPEALHPISSRASLIEDIQSAYLSSYKPGHAESASQHDFRTYYARHGQDECFQRKMTAARNDPIQSPYSVDCQDLDAESDTLRKWIESPLKRCLELPSDLDSKELSPARSPTQREMAGDLVKIHESKNLQIRQNDSASDPSLFQAYFDLGRADSLVAFANRAAQDVVDTITDGQYLADLLVLMAKAQFDMDSLEPASRNMDRAFQIRSRLPESVLADANETEEVSDLKFRARLFAKSGQIDSAIRLLLPAYALSYPSELIQLLRRKYTAEEIVDSIHHALQHIDWRPQATIDPPIRFRAHPDTARRRRLEYPGVISLFGVRVILEGYQSGNPFFPSRKNLILRFLNSHFYRNLRCKPSTDESGGGSI
ncbi:MAG: hypothetical protein IPK50_07715 [Fibrobacterota bacterium]|nr:MAG: hypothetical protein IPK50_07715 [Fibrobacterota bacterium]